MDIMIFYFCQWFGNTNLATNLSLSPCDIKTAYWDFPGGAVVRNLPANAGDTG